MRSGLLVVLSGVLAQTWLGAAELNIATEDYAPFQYVKDGAIKGFSAEIVQEMLARTKIKSEIIMYPWARAYLIAQEKPNTIIFSMARSKEREDMFKWIGPIAPREIWLYRLKEREEIKVLDLEELKNKKYHLGMVTDHSTTKLLMEKGFKTPEHFSQVTNPDQNVKMLLPAASI